MQVNNTEQAQSAVSLRAEQNQQKHASENIAAGKTEPPGRTVEHAEKISAQLDQIKAQRLAKEHKIEPSKTETLTR